MKPLTKLRCSCCGGPRELESQRYCRSCHAAYMREWRATHSLNEAHRKRQNARSYAKVYRRRGKLVQQPCRVCGDRRTEMHHPDHELPLVVVWLCRRCHLAWHAFWRDVAAETWDFWLSRQKRPRKAA